MFTRRLLTAIALSVSSYCSAQGSQPQPRPTIAPATVLVERLDANLPVGSSSSFRLRVNDETERLIRAGVIARVFPMHATDFHPTTNISIDGCDVFFATTFRIVRVGPDQIGFDAAPKLGVNWLNVVNLNTQVTSGHFWIVFELDNGADNHTRSERFRLKTGDVYDYFSSGFRLVVSPAGSNISLQQVLDAFQKREKHLAQLKRESDRYPNSTPCYSFVHRPLTAKSKDSEVPLVLASCENASNEEPVADDA